MKQLDPSGVSATILAEIAGSYPDIGSLNEAITAAYDRHLHEIPGGYGVTRLMDALAQAGYIVRGPDRSLLVLRADARTDSAPADVSTGRAVFDYLEREGVLTFADDGHRQRVIDGLPDE